MRSVWWFGFLLFLCMAMVVAVPASANCERDARRIEADHRAAQDDVRRIRDDLKRDRRAVERSDEAAKRDRRQLRKLTSDYRGLDGQSLSQAQRKARNILNDMERLVRTMLRTEKASLRTLRAMSPGHDRIARIGKDLERKTDALSRACPGERAGDAARWATKTVRDGERSASFFKASIRDRNDRIEWLNGLSDWVSAERQRARRQ